MKKGFNLVELSIVLVIIGLLIGGILVAQSMMNTALITKTVSQIQQFDAGMENFKTKYNSLPGDSKIFGGDGDGLIDSSFSGQYIADFSCEDANFWSGVMPQLYQNVAPCSGLASMPGYYKGPLANMPASVAGVPDAAFYATALCCIGSSGGYNSDTTNPENYYAIVPATPLQTYYAGRYGLYNIQAGSVTPATLLALDKKMDDGSADAGNVKAARITGVDSIQFISPLANCSNGATYIVSSSSYSCIPIIRIGAQAGDPQ